MPSLEVIFVSSDQDAKSFDEYRASMPFKALDYEERELKDELSTKFGVRGIPTLVFLHRDGRVLSKDGRSLVGSHGDEYPWTSTR